MLSASRKLTQILCVLTILTACLLGQTVSSSLQGTVVDPASAVVPNAQIKLIGTETGSTRTATSDNSGLFRILNLAPGTYAITVTAPGFKGYQQNDIVLAANEVHDLGKLPLTIGSSGETVTVTAEAVPVQLASSEKESLVDGNQLSNVTRHQRRQPRRDFAQRYPRHYH